jgi:hypothetical protein
MKKVISSGMTLWLLPFSLPSLAAQTDNPRLIVFAAASFRRGAVGVERGDGVGQ